MPSLPTYRKHHISMHLYHLSSEKCHLSFSVRKKNIIFSGKRNVIFPHDIRKIIFQCNFFGKTIFLEHLKNISYFHLFFWERPSFIFRLKNNIIFSGKRNIIIPDDTGKNIFQCDFFWKARLFKTFGKRTYGFSCSKTMYGNCHPLVHYG